MSKVLEASALKIVEKALSLLRVTDAETPLEAVDRETGIDGLNFLIKFLQVPFHLWTETEAFLPLVKGQERYTLGPDGDECFNASDALFTTLSADAVTGATTISLTNNDVTPAPEILGSDPTVSAQGWTVVDGTLTVDSGLRLTNDTGGAYAQYSLSTEVGKTYVVTCDWCINNVLRGNFEVGDDGGAIVSKLVRSSGNIKLEFTARQQVSYFRFQNCTETPTIYSTLSSLNYIDKSTGDKIGIFLDDNTIQWTNVIFDGPVLADALTQDAASGNSVYAFSELIPRPLEIINTRYRDKYAFTDIPTTQWTMKEYFEQPDKTTQGIVTKWYFKPTLTNSTLYVWAAPSTDQALLAITYIAPLNITVDNADQVEFPSQWYLPLAYQLAMSLAPEYSVPDARMMQITEMGEKYYNQVLEDDNEYSSMSIEVSYRE